jgi:bifunctional DNase/RNase
MGLKVQGLTTSLVKLKAEGLNAISDGRSDVTEHFRCLNKGLRFLPHRMREVQIVDAFDVLYYATIEVQVT